jgi:hypothetical protein
MKFLAYLIVQRGRTATPYRPTQDARPRAARGPAPVRAAVPPQRSPVVRQDPVRHRVRVVVDDVHEPA